MQSHGVTAEVCTNLSFVANFFQAFKLSNNININISKHAIKKFLSHNDDTSLHASKTAVEKTSWQEVSSVVRHSVLNLSALSKENFIVDNF